MLKKLTVSGLKSFSGEDPTEIEFAPLTLLTGTNSSGKSTVLQALLLLKQSVVRPGWNGTSVRLNGPSISLGDYRDWSSNHKSGPMKLGIEFDLSSGADASFDVDFEPDPRRSGIAERRRSAHPRAELDGAVSRVN